MDAAGEEVAVGAGEILEGFLDKAADGFSRLRAKFGEFLKESAEGYSGFAEEVFVLLLVGDLGLLPVSGVREPARVEIDDGAEEEVGGFAFGFGVADEDGGLREDAGGGRLCNGELAGEFGEEPALAHHGASDDGGQARLVGALE